MSSFSDWCKQGAPELRRVQQEAALLQTYPRLARYEGHETPVIEDAHHPASSPEQLLAGRIDRETSTGVEAPERWDSLW